MSPGIVRARERWLRAGIVAACLAAYLWVIVVVVRSSVPGDDTLLLVPMLLDALSGRPAHAIGVLLSPDQKYLPRAGWKLYILTSRWLFGESHVALVALGVLLHACSSALVWDLARQIGQRRRVAWSAALLHLTAYPGSHAYLWPVGVQHTLTIIGILGLWGLYLRVEKRYQDGRSHRPLLAAAVVVAALASLSRVSSVIGPVAVLLHAAWAPADTAMRLRRFDRWRLALLPSFVYPVLLLTRGGDPESAAALPATIVALQQRLTWSIGYLGIGALWMVAIAVSLLAARAFLWAVTQSSGSGRTVARTATRVLSIAALVVAIPWLTKVAVTFAAGVHALVAPLGPALNSHDTARWHMVSFPVDAFGVGFAIAIVWSLACHSSSNRAEILLLTLFVGFSSMLGSPNAQPLRYWAYATPVLAIALASSGHRGTEALARLTPMRSLAPAAGLAALAAVVVSNAAAIRVDTWRHRMADSYFAYEYLRAADLIGGDLRRARADPGTPVCIEGLQPLPYENEWYPVGSGRLTSYNVRAIMATALGRGDVSTVRLRCADGEASGGFTYVARGATILRAGQTIDIFDDFEAEMRRLVEIGAYEAARQILDDRHRPRPFLIRHLIGGLPDDDVVWLTNGTSLAAWLDRIADHLDYWTRHPEPTIQRLRELVSAELASYVRVLFLAHQIETHTNPPGPNWEPPSVRLPFGGLPRDDLGRLLRSDPSNATADGRRVREAILTQPPYLYLKMPGDRLVTPDAAFFGFLTRLLRGDIAPYTDAQ